MSWLNPSSYWDNLLVKSDKTVVEDILVDLFHKKQSQSWLKPSYYWMQLMKKENKNPVEHILIDMFRKHNRTEKTFKCRFGSRCIYTNCTYVHPHQKEYKTSLFVQLEKPCRYETQETACYKKCADKDDSYCIFSHCSHPSQSIIWCTQNDCQGHCPSCI